MKPNIASLLGAALLCGALAVSAEGPAGNAGKGPQHRDGPQKEMWESMKAAKEACRDKPDQRACVSEQMCAKAPDPAKCQARVKEHGPKHAQRMDERQKMHEACTGKRGDELGKCLHEQRGKSGHQRPGQKG